MMGVDRDDWLFVQCLWTWAIDAVDVLDVVLIPDVGRRVELRSPRRKM
jgi:hypothetical protein